MTTIIEITAIRPPKTGKKVATVVAASGQSFEIWPDKMNGLQEGGRYEVEVEEREWNSRTIRKIVNAKPAPAAGNGAATHGAGARMVAPIEAEQAFVARTLAAFIAAGKVGLDARELGEATRLLQRLHSHFFGVDRGTFTTNQAEHGGAHAH
jgi:hypothetical protein